MSKSVKPGGAVSRTCRLIVTRLPPAVLRVAIYDTQWHVSDTVTVDSTKGQTVLQFTDAAKTGVISIRRQDTGEVMVGYEIS